MKFRPIVSLLITALIFLAVATQFVTFPAAGAQSTDQTTTTVETVKQPTLRLSADQPDFRSVISVVGTHFPPRQLVSIAICGNNAINGAIDCDLATSSTVGITTDGEFVADLLVAPPPVECPCVVRAFAFSTSVQQPITLRPFTAISKAQSGTPSLDIERVQVKSEPRLREWTGFDDEKTIEFVVVNHSTVKVQTANVVARTDIGEQLLQFDVDLEPGQEFVYEYVQPVHRIGSTKIVFSALDVNGAEISVRVQQKPALLVMALFLFIGLVIALVGLRKLRWLRTRSDYD